MYLYLRAINTKKWQLKISLWVNLVLSPSKTQVSVFQMELIYSSMKRTPKSSSAAAVWATKATASTKSSNATTAGSPYTRPAMGFRTPRASPAPIRYRRQPPGFAKRAKPAWWTPSANCAPIQGAFLKKLTWVNGFIWFALSMCPEWLLEKWIN